MHVYKSVKSPHSQLYKISSCKKILFMYVEDDTVFFSMNSIQYENSLHKMLSQDVLYIKCEPFGSV